MSCTTRQPLVAVIVDCGVCWHRTRLEATQGRNPHPGLNGAGWISPCIADSYPSSPTCVPSHPQLLPSATVGDRVPGRPKTRSVQWGWERNRNSLSSPVLIFESQTTDPTSSTSSTSTGTGSTGSTGSTDHTDSTDPPARKTTFQTRG